MTRTPVTRAYRLVELLRPLPGRNLPRRLRARRVGALARDLPEGVRDPGFEALVRRIDGGAPVHRAVRVELLTDGEGAAASMLAAIQAAREELLVESYIFTDDETGRRFSDALRAAAARGVLVKVLADGFGSLRTSASFWDQLRDAGVDVRLFHRLSRSLWWQAFRDHRKILVADRSVGFTGGMNIAREYASFHPDRPLEDSMRDTHLRLEGEAARELAAVFAEGWGRAGGEPLASETAPFSAVVPEGPEADPRVLVLDSRPGRGYRETAAVLAAIVAAARESVWIANAYFAPGHLAVAILGLAASRGVDVRLLLPGRTDAPLVRHAGHGYYDRLLRRGVRIFEYRPAILHAKTLVADGYASLVGSTNLDFRSFRFNAECNALVLDRETGEQLARVFEEDLAQSDEIDRDEWRRRSRWHKVGDRIAGSLAPLL